MERRAFLRLLAMGVASHTLDLDRLLWVPGAKKIFIPAPIKLVNMHAILELYDKDRIRMMFERDDEFYKAIKKRTIILSSKTVRVPIHTKSWTAEEKDGKLFIKMDP